MSQNQFEVSIDGKVSEPSAPQRRSIAFDRATPDLKGEGSLLALLQKAMKTAVDREESATHTGVSVGIKPDLINKDVSRQLRDFNATHAICLDAKKSSSTGLGHRDRDIHEALDPLCMFSWQDTLDALSDDYWETGECFLEVVFASDQDVEDRVISGLNHLESAATSIELEVHNRPDLFHFLVEGESTGAEMTLLGRWGDLLELKKRMAGLNDGTANANDVPNSPTPTSNVVNSEVIHIRQSTNRSRYHGYPDYMSAVPSIELVQCMTQHEFDFYFNRGVPEFIMFLIGNGITDECWEEVRNVIKGSQGIGNSHKTGAIAIPGNPTDIVVQIEKLAMDDPSNSGFPEKSGTLDMRIATAHGMPPQLANIALPGKIGAANEGPNAMLTFQMRKLGQAQKNFSGALARTLGDEDVTLKKPGGTSKVTADQFLGKGSKPMDENDMPQFVQPGNGFNTILDGMTLTGAQTMSTMKDNMAVAGGRNPEDGKLDGARERKDGDPKQTR